MIIIDGSFLCRNLTGIERYAFEVTKRLDNLVQDDQIQIYVPKNAKHIPTLKHIQVIISDKDCESFPKFEHFTFSHYARKQHAIPLNFNNLTPFFYPGIAYLHDIYPLVHPEDFTGKRDKLVAKYDVMMAKHVARKAKHIITVSNHSKDEIVRILKVNPERVSVIPNGWDHFTTIQPDLNIFQKFPQLQKKHYFFTLGSLSKRKNLRWIARYAQEHQDQQFVISGKAISGLVPDELKALQTLKNVILAGYLSDGEVKALMQHCKAFVFPSYYEGFGIPPLEALSTGAPIIVSKASCLPEIYQDSAHYIDPNDTNINLDELLTQPVGDPKPILETYTYQKAAEKLYTLMKDQGFLN